MSDARVVDHEPGSVVRETAGERELGGLVVVAWLVVVVVVSPGVALFEPLCAEREGPHVCGWCVRGLADTELQTVDREHVRERG